MRTIQQQATDAAPREHLCSDATHPPDANHSHGLVADFCIVLDDAHALQCHEAAVGVAVNHLVAELRHALTYGGLWWLRLVWQGGVSRE